MSDYGTDTTKVIWSAAAAAALISFVVFVFVLGYTFWPGLFLAVLIAVLVAILVWIAFYRSSETQDLASGPVMAAANDDRPAPVIQSVPPAPRSRTEEAASGMMGKAGEKLKKDVEAAVGRPQGLDLPREGGADDLKMIKGVGPKLERVLNDMGFYHFDQIAGWTPSEGDWVDRNLKGFKGRVSRDNWIEQARILATGGETDFSKRVEGGDVY